MAWFRKEEDISLKLLETRKSLMKQEAEFSAIIRMERNAVMNAKTKSSRVSAEERLRNAYISLRMVHIAQERLHDVGNTLELTSAMQDLRKSVAVLNAIDKKSDKSVLFLNKHIRKILERKSLSEGGGMKQFYDESIDELLIGEETMSGLLNPEIPLKAVLKQDEETLENVDSFMEFAVDKDNGYKVSVTNTNTSDMSDLLDAWSCNRG